VRFGVTAALLALVKQASADCSSCCGVVQIPEHRFYSEDNTKTPHTVRPASLMCRKKMDSECETISEKYCTEKCSSEEGSNTCAASRKGDGSFLQKQRSFLRKMAQKSGASATNKTKMKRNCPQPRACGCTCACPELIYAWPVPLPVAFTQLQGPNLPCMGPECGPEGCPDVAPCNCYCVCRPEVPVV